MFWWVFIKGFKSKGVHMVILNVLRILTLIGLIIVMPACWALAIKIDMSKSYFVFDAASLVFMSGIALFLALSELPWGTRFFEAHWPAFGPNRGIGWLGLALIMVGCNVLGKLNNSKTEADEIGLPWWRLVLASGILNLAFGVLNVFFGLLFGSGSSNARQVRSFGSSSSGNADKLPQYDSASSYNEKEKPSSLLSPLKRVACRMTGVLQRRGDDHACKDSPPSRKSSIPTHHDIKRVITPVDMPAAPESYRNSYEVGEEDRLNHRNEAFSRLSGADSDGMDAGEPKPMTSPIAPHVPRPDSHQHPFYKRFEAQRPPSSVYEGPKFQRYSATSKLSHFPAAPYNRL